MAIENAPAEQQPQVHTANIQSEKKSCDLEFFSRANEFVQKSLSDIPELQAVAIIPLWAPQLEGVPSGLLRLRNETQPYFLPLIKMLAQITAFGADIHRDMFMQLKAVDQVRLKIEAEIAERSALLEKLRETTGQIHTAETSVTQCPS